MGNRNKKKGKTSQLNASKQAPANQTKPAPAITPAPANGTSPTIPPVRRRFAWVKLSRNEIASWIAIFIAVASAAFSFVQMLESQKQTKINQEQAKVAKDAQERATGKISAKIKCAEYRPGPDDFPKEMRTEAFGWNQPYYKDIESFLTYAPRLWINNIGDEPIDAIKITTSMTRSTIDMPKQSKVEQGILVREEEREEIPLNQHLRPGRAIQVSLLKGLLGQMIQKPTEETSSVMHYAELRVTISGRLAGSAVFGSDSTEVIVCVVVWIPSGFPDEKCQDVLKDYQTFIDHGPERPILIGKKKTKELKAR
jgi:hypothetical protein